VLPVKRSRGRPRKNSSSSDGPPGAIPPPAPDAGAGGIAASKSSLAALIEALEAQEQLGGSAQQLQQQHQQQHQQQYQQQYEDERDGSHLHGAGGSCGSGQPEKRKRGRPRGSTTAPKDDAQALLAQSAFLLRPRAGGKRAVKLNMDAFADVIPSANARWAAPADSGDDDGQYHGGRGSGVSSSGGGGNHAAAIAAAAAGHPRHALPLPGDRGFVDGAHLPRRRLKKRRTSYGWALLGQLASIHQPHVVQHRVQQLRAGSSGVAVSGAPGHHHAAAGSGGVHHYAAAGGGVGGHISIHHPNVHPLAAFDDLDGAGFYREHEEEQEEGSDAYEWEEGAPRQHRWVAGTYQWRTDDGVTIWPKVG
jgi:hypothetical protein